MKPSTYFRVLVLLFTLAGWAAGAQARAQEAPVAPAREEAPRVRRPVVWNNPGGPAQPGITHYVLASQAMEREIGYNVYLPPGYAENALRYPVIYFLHGAGGNENSDGPGFSRILARLIERGEVAPALGVFPNGGMSFYRDHPEEKIMVETMLMKELIPLIDATFRTRAERGSRIIAGYSMGSGGSARLALKYPDMFGATGGWGLSFLGRDATAPLGPEFGAEALQRSPQRVRMLMIIGLEDPGLAAYAPAVAALTAGKVAFTYRTLAGVGHNLGLYYELTGEDMVRFLLEGVEGPTP